MIGHIQGEVLFSDGSEVIVLTTSGIGYQVYCDQVLAEGSFSSLFISHVIKEASEDLYGFKTLRSKKMFELLTSVKGVGPKSAYNLIAALGVNQIITAVEFEDKKSLTKAPGVGPKAAAQMILDLSGKITKVKMYSDTYKIYKSKTDLNISASDIMKSSEIFEEIIVSEEPANIENTNEHHIMNEAIMACKELGFKEENIVSLAQEILANNSISKPEQLVHLVLKQI